MKYTADLRGLPVWDRARAVFEQAAVLKTGDVFEVLTELDPRALLARLEQQIPGELDAGSFRAGEREWRLTLSRAAGQTESSPLSRAVRRSAAFSKLGDASRAQLLESAKEHLARKGETVRPEDSSCEDVGLLLEGALGVFTCGSAREHLLYNVFPGDAFGTIEFFDGGRAIGRTVAVSKTARYALLPRDLVLEVCMREPAALIALAAFNSQLNRSLATAMNAHVSQPAIARVASALLPYAIPERGLEPALPPLANMTQAQVAAAAGTVKEVAARAIAELERRSALRRERGHVRYLDRSKLLEAIGSA